MAKREGGYNGPNPLYGFGIVDEYIGIAGSADELPSIVELYEAAVYLDVPVQFVHQILVDAGYEFFEYDDCGDPVYRRRDS